MPRRVLLPALALGLLPVLASCGTSDPSTVAEPPVPSGAPSGTPPAVASGVPGDTVQQSLNFVVAHGKVSADTGRVSVKLGSTLRITVLSDAADTIHVHLYDLTQALSAGEPGYLEFVADKPGVVEVELEHQKIPLTHLQVQ